MTQDPQQDPTHQQNQLYDASFKGWILQQAPAILPILLPGTIYQETLDVEILRSPMRADKVFKVRYHDEEHVLHLEFEVGYDKELKSRLLVYNSVLYRDHHLPVLTVVVYPFHVKMAESPLCILIQKQPILTFVFQTFPLFKLNAKEMVQQRYTCMYPLLPTMKNVDIYLVEQAVQELLEIYRDEKKIVSRKMVMTLRTSGVDNILLPVGDFAEVRAFYEERLGLPVKFLIGIDDSTLLPPSHFCDICEELFVWEM